MDLSSTPVNSPATPIPSIPPKQSQQSNKQAMIIVAVVILFVVTAVLVIIKVYFSDMLFSAKKKVAIEPSNAPIGVISKNEDTIQLPASLSDENLSNVGILYDRKGVVKDIKRNGDSLSLTLDPPVKGIPTNFSSHPLIRIFYTNEKRTKFQPATWDDVQRGKQVIVGMDSILKGDTWNVEKNSWRVLYVHLIQPEDFFDESPSNQTSPSNN